jgi:stage III sporulation protein AE
MKKKILVLLMGFMLITSFRVYALDEKTPSVDLSKLDAISERLQQDNEYLPDLNLSRMINTYKENGSIGLTLKDFMDSLVKFIFREAYGNLRLLLELLLIGILCAVLQNIRDSFKSKDIASIGYYVCYIAMVLLVIKSFTLAIGIGRNTINSMIEFTNAMMPALLVLIASVGGFASAATLDPIMLFVIKATSNVIRDFVLPMTIVVMVLNIVNNMSDNIKVSKLAGLMKQLCTWSLGLIITMFIGFITVRSGAATTLDQVTLKTTKFAVDNFIPVIGKALSDAITTVAGYSLILKDAVSIVGLIVMIFICIFPLIKIILIGLTYKFVGAVMEPIVDKRIVDCLTSAGNSLTIVFSSVLAVGVMFFILITIIASTGKLVMATG